MGGRGDQFDLHETAGLGLHLFTLRMFRSSSWRKSSLEKAAGVWKPGRHRKDSWTRPWKGPCGEEIAMLEIDIEGRTLWPHFFSNLSCQNSISCPCLSCCTWKETLFLFADIFSGKKLDRFGSYKINIRIYIIIYIYLQFFLQRTLRLKKVQKMGWFCKWESTYLLKRNTWHKFE